jgi:hypothetical protein
VSAPGDRRPGLRQHGIPGLEYDRLWSRRAPRTTDPLNDPDRCPDCDGTAVDLGAAEPEGECSSCLGTGWRS